MISFSSFKDKEKVWLKPENFYKKDILSCLVDMLKKPLENVGFKYIH